MNVRMYIRMYVCMYVHTFIMYCVLICVHMYVHMYICRFGMCVCVCTVCVCMYVLYVCVYVLYVCTHTHQATYFIQDLLHAVKPVPGCHVSRKPQLGCQGEVLPHGKLLIVRGRELHQVASVGTELLANVVQLETVNEDLALGKRKGEGQEEEGQEGRC